MGKTEKTALSSAYMDSMYERHHDLSDEMTAFIGEDAHCKPHFHRKLELIYLIEGALDIGLGDAVYHCQADDIIFVHHYEKHSYTPKKSYKKYVFLLSPSLSSDFLARFNSATLPAVMNDRACNRALKPLFTGLLESIAAEDALQIKGYLSLIFGKLIAHYGLQPFSKTGNSKLILEILDYIDRHFSRPLSLGALAAAFGYNRYHISKLWSQYIGTNLSVYVNQIRLRHAAEHLKADGENKIADIAYACGFDSLTTFYRYFQAHFAVSPKQFIGNSAT